MNEKEIKFMLLELIIGTGMMVILISSLIIFFFQLFNIATNLYPNLNVITFYFSVFLIVPLILFLCIFVLLIKPFRKRR